MKTIKETLDLRYLAGFIDGEGCIGIAKTKNGMAKGRPRYFPFIAIVNSNLGILKIIKHMYPKGRKIIEIKKTLGHKKIYNLRIDGNELINILEDIMPYLIDKKRQAELVLEFKKNMRKSHETKQILSKETMEIRENYYKTLRILKKNPTEANLPILEAGRF